jgi:hypothetical protein
MARLVYHSTPLLNIVSSIKSAWFYVHVDAFNLLIPYCHLLPNNYAPHKQLTLIRRFTPPFATCFDHCLKLTPIRFNWNTLSLHEMCCCRCYARGTSLSLKDFLEQAFGPWSFVSSLIKDDDMVPPSQADSERQSMLCQLSRFAKSTSERIETLS